MTEFPSSYSGARALVVQPDGPVVAAGFAHTNDSIVSDFALTRYDVTGVLDAAFGIGGRVRTDFGGRFDEALAVAVQPDGKIVVTGNSSDATGSDITVARYTNDGNLDTSFDGDGMALVEFGGEASARAVALQRHGRIVLAGRDEIRDLAVDREGHIVAGGQSCEFPGTSDEVCGFGLARYTARGTLDPRFGHRGRARTDLGADLSEGIRGVVVQQPDNRIVVAGQTNGPRGPDVGLTRYLSDGRLDRSFGVNGVGITPVSPSTDEVGGLHLDQPTGWWWLARPRSRRASSTPTADGGSARPTRQRRPPPPPGPADRPRWPSGTPRPWPTPGRAGSGGRQGRRGRPRRAIAALQELQERQ